MRGSMAQGEHGPGQPDTEIVEQVGVTRQTVEKVRKRCVQDGLAATLVRRKRSRERATVLDGEGEARVATRRQGGRGGPCICCARVEAASGSALDIPRDGAQGAKKNELKPWRQEMWCIPPQHNAAFVCGMENVLEVYTRPYDASFPVICMDESSKQCVRSGHRKGCVLAMQRATTPSTSATGWDIC